MSDTTDIVAELDRWLDMWPVGDDPMDMIQRARDEIVRLRTLLTVCLHSLR